MVLHDDDHMCMFCTERFESQEDWTLHLALAHNVHQGAALHHEAAPPTPSDEIMDPLLSPFQSPTLPSVQPASCNSPTTEPAAFSHLPTPEAFLNTPTAAYLPPQTPAQLHETPNPTVPSQVSSQGTTPQPKFQIINGLALPRMAPKVASQTSAQLYATPNSSASGPTSSQGTPLQPNVQISNGLALPRMASKVTSQTSAPLYTTPNSSASGQTSSQGTPPQPIFQIINGLALPRMASKVAPAGQSPPAVQCQSTIRYATTPATPQDSQAITRCINIPATPQDSQSNIRTIKVPKTPKVPRTTAAITPPTRSSALPPLPQAIVDLGLSDADFDPNADHNGFRTSANNNVDISPSIGLPDEHMFNAHCNKIIAFGNLLRLASRYTHADLIRKLNTNRTQNRFKSALITKRLKAAAKWATGRPEWQGVGDVEAWLEGRRRAVESELRAQLPQLPQFPQPPAQLPQAPKRKRADEPSDACQEDGSWAYGDASPTPTKRARTGAAAPSAPAATATDPIDLTGGELAAAPIEQPAEAPTAAATGSSKYTLTATDLADLSDHIGSENALALVHALGMGGGDAASVPQGAGEADVASPDVFAEFLAQPADFVSAEELRMGEALGRFCETWMERRGLRW